MSQRPQASPAPQEDEVTPIGILAPLIERWRVLAISLLAVWALIGLTAIVSPRQYEATLQLAAISSSRSLPNLGSLSGAASLLGGALGGLQPTGLQVTPPLVKALLGSRQVLGEVGSSTTAPIGERIVDRVAGRPVPEERVLKVMSEIVRTSIDRETGLISLRVTFQDSALARLIATRLLMETRKTYVAIARAQASQQREGQQARVDSASTQLADAEHAMNAFETSNRALTDYSRKVIERKALERRVQIAQQVYLQAATDHEAAVARELEATPVVAIVDSIPASLPRAPRYTVLKLMLAGIAVTLVWGFLVLIGEGLRRASEADQDVIRFRRAVSRLPLAGRWTSADWRGPSEDGH